jgi:hypothetical protein
MDREPEDADGLNDNARCDRDGPAQRSVTSEVMAGDETVYGGGRFATDRAGYQALMRYARTWPNRVWAIEGCSGIGHHEAMRLLADDEQVLDVPPKLSARTRVFATGQGRKTDATDARRAGRPTRSSDRSRNSGRSVLVATRRTAGESWHEGFPRAAAVFRPPSPIRDRERRHTPSALEFGSPR